MKRVLIVEDDREMSALLAELLRRNSFSVDTAGNSEEAWAHDIRRYEIFILDIRLSGENGIDFCKELRRWTKAPILFLTASDDEDTVVRGLQAGGDDYVVKPFRTRELLARLEALIRRNEISNNNKIIKSGDIELDSIQKSVRYRGEELHFSVMEYQLLEILISNRGRRVSREILLDSVWDGHGDLPEDNSLSVYIARIRKKLKEIDLEGAIETCYGRGYCWIEPQNR